MARIFLIEDNQELRDNTRRILSLHDHEIFAFADGESALEAFPAQSPELILCDVTLPGVGGHEVLRRIRQCESKLPVPFVFLSALASRDDVRRGMSVGADDYLTKPFSIEELMSAVSTQLAQAARLREANARINADFEKQKLHCLPHEIRTPLNGILGGLSVLRMDLEDASADIKETLELIDVSAQRLERTMLNYVLHAEIASGRYAVSEPEETDMVSWLQPICRSEAANFGRELDLEFGLVDLTHAVPRDAMEKIIREVLSNSVKFSEPESPVVVRMECFPSHWVLVVADRGRGMTQDEIGRIGPFQQFQRGQWEQQGLGLGLEICQRISALAGWVIQFSSIQPTGLQVRIEVPMHPERTSNDFHI